jgi:hypothetical protein
MVGLGEGGVAVAGGRVRVAEREINSETEEDLVVDVYMLTHRLIGVQGDYFTFNDCDRTLSCCFDKVAVYFSDSAVSLHPLNIVVSWKVLDNLELLVPIVQLLQINSMKGHNCLPEIL